MRWWPGVALVLLVGCAGGNPLTGGTRTTCEASIVGTTAPWDDDCYNNQSFKDCCASQGGVNAGFCYGATSSCTDEGSRCYAPPAQPQGEQHLCDGVMVCEGTQFCVRAAVFMDGCSYPRCVAFPLACANDLTCQCLIRQNATTQDNCSEDAQGHVAVQDRGRF